MLGQIGKLLGIILVLPAMAQAGAVTIGFEGVVTVNDPAVYSDITQFDERFPVGSRVHGSYEIADRLADFRGSVRFSV